MPKNRWATDPPSREIVLGCRMIQGKKTSALNWGALALLALILLQAEPAVSQIKGGPSHEEYQRLLERLDTLETQLKAVEDEAECSFPYQMTAPGVFRLKPECSAALSCAPPFSVDERGIKQLDMECPKAEAVSSCDPPYRIDENGHKTFIPECL